MKKSTLQKNLHRPRELSSKHPIHIVQKTNVNISFQEHKSLKFFREKFKEIAKRYGVVVFEYSIQKNHIHLFILSGSVALISHAMAFLNSKVALYFNRRLGRTGKFWSERYFSSVKKSGREIINTIKYIANQLKHRGPFDNIYNSLTQSSEYPWGIHKIILNRIGVGKSPFKLREVIESGKVPYRGNSRQRECTGDKQLSLFALWA